MQVMVPQGFLYPNPWNLNILDYIQGRNSIGAKNEDSSADLEMGS